MFKPDNIIKLSIGVTYIRKVAKSLKIGTSSLKIKPKEENCTTANAKDIIPLFRAFYIYTEILFFSAALSNKLQIQLALGKYAEHLIMLQEMYN